ncbi:MAG: redox-sensing transcriptional repressor Rex [Candidatus Coatesbacteria bacterium]|nr:redox-sensing transcriptional repressor Rex [Candidatus Coatesbacteria bacterium]
MTLLRASLYLRYLTSLENEGRQTISSKELADEFSVSAALVRKDLGLFGAFGKAGIGYDVKGLKDSLLTTLGLKRAWKAAIVGAGRLGLALAGHKGLLESRFKIAAIFDKYPERTAAKTDSSLEVLPVDDLPRVVRERGIELGIIAVPGASAQEAAETAVKAGIRAILNFAPTHINVPQGVFVRSVDITIYLENLAYYVNEAYHPKSDADGRG